MGARRPLILVVSNGGDATADFFQAKLAEHGAGFLRLDTEHLPTIPLDTELAGDAFSGAFVLGGRRVAFSEITAVYYRRPRAPDVAGVDDPDLRAWMQNEFRKAWGGLLFSLAGVRWVNHPVAIGGASYKPEQLARAARQGLDVPPTRITSDPASARRFCAAHGWRVVAKPLGHGEIRAGGPGRDDRFVFTSLLDESTAPALDEVAACPTLLQAFVEKRLDLRVTVAGSEAVAVAVHSQESALAAVDWRRAQGAGVRYSEYALPDAVRDRLVALTRSYGLLYSAIDLAVDGEGKHWFLELNPAGQWAWLEMELGVPISAALLRCLSGDRE